MHIISKQGNMDNVLTYEHICDTIADMNNIEKKYITLGSTCIVLSGSANALEAYMADSNKEWHELLVSGSETGGNSGINTAVLKTLLAPTRVSSLEPSKLLSGNIIEAIGTPTYVEDISQYANYGLTNTGWYVFSRIAAPENTIVSASTTITGADGYILTSGTDHIDIAIRFDVAATSKTITINWGSEEETFIFKATDLAINNLDYRVTFYVYDVDDYLTWEYGLTTDTTFVEDKTYYTLSDGEYIAAEVTVGDEVPENTYYNHTKVIFSGLTPNITYKCNTIIDCPMEFILPAVDNDTHGCWFEIRCRHNGSYSMTLTPPDDTVKIATEHTQAETKGLNMINLHYTNVCGVKLWRFMNTHSTIPA